MHWNWFSKEEKVDRSVAAVEGVDGGIRLEKNDDSLDANSIRYEEIVNLVESLAVGEVNEGPLLDRVGVIEVIGWEEAIDEGEEIGV